MRFAAMIDPLCGEAVWVALSKWRRRPPIVSQLSDHSAAREHIAANALGGLSINLPYAAGAREFQDRNPSAGQRVETDRFVLVPSHWS
jgi:hypothetical protein